MAVTYDVLFRSGLKLPRAGGCFGACAEGAASGFGWWHQNGPRVDQAVYDRVNNHVEEHVSLRFYPQPKGSYVDRGIWEHLQKLIDSLPWMKEVLILRPFRSDFGCVDVITGNLPADQPIMALMSVRSLLQDRDGEVFLNALDQGLTHVQAWVMAGSFYANRGIEGLSYARKGVGEYNLFCTYSFGYQSIAQMMTPGYNPWRLDSWQALNGYRREYWIGDNYPEKRSISGHHRGPILVDILSVENDDQLFAYDEFQYGGMLNNMHISLTPEQFAEKCQELVGNWPNV